MEIAALEQYKVVFLLEDTIAVQHILKYLAKRPINFYFIWPWMFVLFKNYLGLVI